MTKDELNLALKHAKRDERHLSNAETRYWCDQYKLLATQAIEALAQQNEFKPDWDEKLALTEEVIRLSKRIKELEAQTEQHQDWCSSLTQMLMSMPPKPAPCNCKPPQPKEPEQEPRNIRERWNIEFDGDDLLVCFNDHEKKRKMPL